MRLQSQTLLNDIRALFAERGDEPYGESVSQRQHALQCVVLAEQADCAPSLIVAALLHDIGHLYEDPAEIDRRDLRHEELAATLLRGCLPESVWQPIRLHVAAKRYLCAREPEYFAGISPASRQSLALQGGPFSEAECEAFLRAPYAVDAIVLRRIDDQGKDPAMPTPPLDHFLPLVDGLVLSK
ncbi:MAG: HD domain-containing protein [Gammaproteobacteria bacterium]|nr:HD domain-containing protein [Gammaproteobacteria bacterium]